MILQNKLYWRQNPCHGIKLDTKIRSQILWQTGLKETNTIHGKLFLLFINVRKYFLVTIYNISYKRVYITENELLHCIAYMLMETLIFLQVPEESDATTKPFMVDITMLEDHTIKV